MFGCLYRIRFRAPSTSGSIDRHWQREDFPEWFIKIIALGDYFGFRPKWTGDSVLRIFCSSRIACALQL
jgi:hypothetical protein